MADVDVLTAQEARRFITGGGRDPRADITLAWELLYRLEPELYERLIRAERIHPGVLAWLPPAAGRVVEVGAGTGRLTMELVGRARELVAIEPAAPLREILRRKLAAAGPGQRVRVTDGFIDELPVRSGCADLVVACSMVTPEAGSRRRRRPGGDGADLPAWAAGWSSSGRTTWAGWPTAATSTSASTGRWR